MTNDMLESFFTAPILFFYFSRKRIKELVNIRETPPLKIDLFYKKKKEGKRKKNQRKVAQKFEN